VKKLDLSFPELFKVGIKNFASGCGSIPSSSGTGEMWFMQDADKTYFGNIWRIIGNFLDFASLAMQVTGTKFGWVRN